MTIGCTTEMVTDHGMKLIEVPLDLIRQEEDITSLVDDQNMVQPDLVVMVVAGMLAGGIMVTVVLVETTIIKIGSKLI